MSENGIDLTAEQLLAAINNSSLASESTKIVRADLENAIALLKSADVIKPVQSNNLVTAVFEDNRGKIMRLGKEGEERNYLLTYAGFMRSGDFHPVKQFDVIISGQVTIWYRVGEKDIKIDYAATPNPTLIILPPYIPHLFEFTDDCEMLEWWEGSFEACYYKPYRDIINVQSEKMSPK